MQTAIISFSVDDRIKPSKLKIETVDNGGELTMQTVINLEPITSLTREQFYQLCLKNPDLQIERSPQGELIIMSPVGGESGRRESKLNFRVSLWNEQTQLGHVFSSSTIFSLPNGGGSEALL